MFAPSSREYDNVIDVNQDEVLFAWSEDLIDQSLECEWCIHKSKWHYQEEVIAELYGECCILNMFWSHFYLMESRSQIESGEI